MKPPKAIRQPELKGMKLEDTRGAYLRYSTKASDVSRQLAFAALALVWLFGSGDKSPSNIPHDLRLAGLLSALSLACDLAQYSLGALIWGVYNRYKEGEVGPEDKFSAPFIVNWPMIGLFWAKLMFLAAAYWIIARHLAGTL